MKTSTMRTVIIGLITVGLVAMGTIAFAGKGMGDRDEDNPRGGHGRHHQGYDCPYGPQANLTDEQREQLDAERRAFFESTRTERQDLYAKRLELRAEIAKRNPDAKKAAALQQQASDLQGSLNQKRLTHIMKMQEINPDARMACIKGGRGMRDHGRGGRMGEGRGSCRQ